MRLFRPAAALLALPLVAPLPADAAPKRPSGCPVVDPRGDAGPLGSGNLDIVSGDLAAGQGEVVAVLRLAGADRGLAQEAGEARWRLEGSGNGVRYAFELRQGLPGARPSSSATVGGVAADHAFQFSGATLVWRVLRKGGPALARPKIAWRDCTASTSAGPLAGDTADGRGRG